MGDLQIIRDFFNKNKNKSKKKPKAKLKDKPKDKPKAGFVTIQKSKHWSDTLIPKGERDDGSWKDDEYGDLIPRKRDPDGWHPVNW